MKKSLLLFSIGLLASALSIGAYAGKDAKRCDSDKANSYMQKIDTNEDGYISRDEFVAHSESHFDKLDANADGVVDQDEFKAKHKKKHKKESAS